MDMIPNRVRDTSSDGRDVVHTLQAAGRVAWQQARVASAVVVMAGSALVTASSIATIPAAAVTVSPTPTWSQASPATSPRSAPAPRWPMTRLLGTWCSSGALVAATVP